MATPWLMIEHPKTLQRYTVDQKAYEDIYAPQGYKVTSYEDGTPFAAPKRATATTRDEKATDKGKDD